MKGGKGVELISPVWTADEVCEYLQIHAGTLYKLVRNHQFPAFHMGSDWRFNIEQVEAWAREREALTRKK